MKPGFSDLIAQARTEGLQMLTRSDVGNAGACACKPQEFRFFGNHIRAHLDGITGKRFTLNYPVSRTRTRGAKREKLSRFIHRRACAREAVNATRCNVPYARGERGEICPMATYNRQAEKQRTQE